MKTVHLSAFGSFRFFRGQARPKIEFKKIDLIRHASVTAESEIEKRKPRRVTTGISAG